MKQVILVRTDLKLPPGKLSAQVSHASLEAALKTSKEKFQKWKQKGSKKVVLSVPSKQDLLNYKQKAEKLRLKTSLIKDAARTVLKTPDYTCLAIGPDKEEIIDKVTGNLKLLK